MPVSYAYPLELSAGQLRDFLACLSSSLGQAILESVCEVRFVGLNRAPDDCQFDERFDPEKWEKGRAFGEALEVRWRRRQGRYATLLVHDAAALCSADLAGLQNFALPEPVMLERLDDTSAMLWGEWQRPDPENDLPGKDRHYWYELRIPQFLAYPWDQPDPRLRMRVAQYRMLPDAEDEAGMDFAGDRIYRFVGLEAFTPSAPAEDTSGEADDAEAGEEDDEYGLC